MDGAGTVRGEGGAVRRRRITAVALEPVGREVLGLVGHECVAVDLGDHGGSRNRQHGSVPSDHRHDPGAEPQVVVIAVEDDAVGEVALGFDLREGAPPGRAERRRQAEAVAFIVAGVADPDGERPWRNAARAALALAGREHLRVANPHEVTVGRDDRGNGHGAGPGAPPHLVDATDDSVTGAPVAPLCAQRRPTAAWCHGSDASKPGRAGRDATREGACYDRAVDPGTRVEVRSRFDQRWSRGFEISDVVDEAGITRYRLRRRSDGALLPVLFDDDDVREEKRRSKMWWV